jgi:hypothetical protein
MNLSNAKLLRVDVPGPPVGGNKSFTNGAALAIDCVLDAVKSQQRFTIGAAISDATAVMYLMRDNIPAGTAIDKGYRVLAQLDGEPAFRLPW